MYTTTIAVRERGHQIASQLGAIFHVRDATLQSTGFGVFHQAAEWTVNPGAPRVAIKQNEFAR
jgi:hypothetical protein